MRQVDWRIAPLMIVMATPLILAGCASEGSVEHANTEANSAMTAADQSKAEANKALSTAQQALKEAQAANTTAQQASESSNRMYQRSLQK